jgi:hypothetical protein
MSRSWRAFYGAALGALLVLLAHPVSRPFLLTALSKWGSAKTFQNNTLILESQSELPVPKNLVDASLWMQDAAIRILQPQNIQPSEWTSFFNVASYAAQQDEDNAYWVQMQAVLTNALANTPNVSKSLHGLAVEEWIRASRLSRWDDYQTRRLRTLQGQLARESGGNAAWQYAAVYPLRVSYTADAIEGLARELLRNLDTTSKSALRLRYATLMNGKLMREGSRSIAIGEVGVDLVEMSTYPKEIAPEANPRALVIARTDFYHGLIKVGMPDEARTALNAFKSNEAWLALLQQESINNRTSQLRVASLLTIDVPGALLALSAVGGFVWLLSGLFRRNPSFLRVLEAPWAIIIGFVLAALIYWVTQLALASVAVFACFGFLTFNPIHDRTNAQEPLGPVFEVTQFILGITLSLLLLAFMVGLSTPGCQILQEMSVPRDFYGGSTLLLGLAGIVLALLGLAAPCWAIIQRIATPIVVVMSLRQFGRSLFLGSLMLSIASTPICIIVDHFVQKKLDNIVANEPVFYLPT